VPPTQPVNTLEAIASVSYAHTQPPMLAFLTSHVPGQELLAAPTSALDSSPRVNAEATLLAAGLLLSSDQIALKLFVVFQQFKNVCETTALGMSVELLHNAETASARLQRNLPALQIHLANGSAVILFALKEFAAP
jgi:hypothetical protein